MGDFVSIETIKDAQIFLLLGLFGGIGVLSLVISYRMVEPSLLAFEYFGIPISFILGWLFFAAPFEILLQVFFSSSLLV